MTPEELFDKVEQEIGHTSLMIRHIANEMPALELYKPIPSYALFDFYETCYRCLQMTGMQLTNGDPNYDAEIWRKITETLNHIQRVLNEEFESDLPEREVVSIVQEMVDAGFLKTIEDINGRECVALEENPYDIKIRIVRTPLGQAPKEVRNGWIGVELPARFIPGVVPVTGLVTKSLEFQKDGVFQVPYRDAIEQLAERAPEAAQWFIENLGEDRLYPLMFDAQCAEKI